MGILSDSWPCVDHPKSNRVHRAAGSSSDLIEEDVEEVCIERAENDISSSSFGASDAGGAGGAGEQL